MAYSGESCFLIGLVHFVAFELCLMGAQDREKSIPIEEIARGGVAEEEAATSDVIGRETLCEKKPRDFDQDREKERKKKKEGPEVPIHIRGAQEDYAAGEQSAER